MDGERISIDRWNGSQDIADAGLFVQIKRKEQASIQYAGDHARFRIAPAPSSSEYVASRISEIDLHLDVEQRVKRWKPTTDKSVEAKFRVRFLHEHTALTYNLMLWNAPFKKEMMIPAMCIGVTCSAVSDFKYAAVIAQNLIANPQSNSFKGDVLQFAEFDKVAGWLCMTEWHWIHVTFAQDQARVEIQQGARQAIVVEEGLLPPVEALGFVFSVDNEVFPGRYIPVSAEHEEGFDMAYFEVGYHRRQNYSIEPSCEKSA
ncbi:MAG: hypothetical protein JXB30_06310 [Anaerolineae bacterium]|nr:hypothetical protein [Anaerolineae bacterium]